MSTHSNQKTGTPSSSRKVIRGSNPTYKASVQEESRTRSSEVNGPAKTGTRKETGSKGDGRQRNTVVKSDSTTNANVMGGYGSGHYKAN